VASAGADRIASATRAQVRRKGVQQAGDRLVERPIGDHRGDHRAHPDIGVGARDLAETLDAGDRQHGRQVVAGGAALADHLDGGQQRGKVAIVVGAAAIQPGAGVEQQFQRPAIAGAFCQTAMAVGVGIHQAGDDQPSGGVDPARRLRGAGSNDRDDAVALDQDIGRACGGVAVGDDNTTCVMIWSACICLLLYGGRLVPRAAQPGQSGEQPGPGL
jgi:hypothetical protein